jgi:DNA topoisomerase-1
MRLAQQLYEGVDYGEGAVGLITYMRTDAVNLANEAIGEIRGVIAKLYGADSVPEAPRYFKNKSRNAQEAHEAIRPTSAAVTPQLLEGRIDNDLHRLVFAHLEACRRLSDDARSVRHRGRRPARRCRRPATSFVCAPTARRW